MLDYSLIYLEEFSLIHQPEKVKNSNLGECLNHGHHAAAILLVLGLVGARQSRCHPPCPWADERAAVTLPSSLSLGWYERGSHGAIHFVLGLVGAIQRAGRQEGVMVAVAAPNKDGT